MGILYITSFTNGLISMHTLLITTLVCLLVYLTIYSTKLRYVRPFSYIKKTWELYNGEKVHLKFSIDKEDMYGVGLIIATNIFHFADDGIKWRKAYRLYLFKVNFELTIPYTKK